MNTASGHVPALDGLRGIAILLVIPHNSDIFPAVHNWMTPFAMLAHCGWIGVQLFFVLSGFLITGNLLDSRGASRYYSSFFGRRILRIFPLYFLALIFFLKVLPAITTLSPQILSSYGQQTWLWLFLSNWTQPSLGAVYWFPHFWSLALEEQFYLVWPFVVAALREQRLLEACVFAIGVAFLVRIGLLVWGASSDAIYLFTISRMDALAFGAMTAILLRRPGMLQRVREHGSFWLLTALGMIAIGAAVSRVYSTKDPVTMTVGYTMLSFAMSVILAVTACGGGKGIAARLRTAMANPFLRSVGRYSFAMYVFHLPISLLAGDRLTAALRPLGAAYPLLYSLVIIAASYGAAAVSYHLYERHFLKLKRYFVTRPAPIAISAA